VIADNFIGPENDAFVKRCKKLTIKDRRMSIITISRGSYSRGKEVAEKLAQRLGYDCISRDILLEASNEFNTPEIKLIRALHDAPTVLERFTHGKVRYLSYLRSSLLNYVLKDNVVYHGLAGHYFLQGVPHVLKVRIIADIEDRVREEMKRENISGDEARYILKKDDEERRKWGMQIYGTDTWDCNLYDIVLHIGRITVDDAVDVLHNTVQKPAFQKTPASENLIKDMALSAKVLGKLAQIAPDVNVKSIDGVVVVLNSGALAENIVSEIKKTAETVEGVKAVLLNGIETKAQQDHINPFYNIK
jgi:cytidylate kinase